MRTPKVSVIIPSYNHYQYLKQRIESVLDQTYRNFEIIILDDCSSDKSREIIIQYQNDPFVKKIIFNDKNSGNPFEQWRRGIALAEGEWIWFAESDDYADPRFLETLISALENKKNVGLLYCDSRIVQDNILLTESFASIKNKKYKTNRWSVDYTSSGIEEIENYLLPGGTINNSSAVLFNKNIVLEVNPFDIDLRYIGDKYTFIKVLAKSNVVYVKESLNYYRDPFNVKHVDKFVFYFYEQFLVFNWAYKNLRLSDKKRFYEGFHSNTRNSLFRDWNKTKRTLYGKLFWINPYLLLRSILYNLLQSVNSIFQLRGKRLF